MIRKKASSHVPMRTCLVCRARKPRDGLIRLVLEASSALVVQDSQRRLPGRGAYACETCMPKLSYTNRVRQAFRNKAKGLSERLRGLAP